MAVERYYNLRFTTYQGTVATIRIPKATITSLENISAAMQKIINSNAIAHSEGVLKEISGAELVTTTITDCAY